MSRNNKNNDNIGNNEYYTNINNNIINCHNYKNWLHENQVYCLCNKTYDPNEDTFMVQCDTCREWYHPQCVNQTQEQIENMDFWECLICNDENEDQNTQNNDNEDENNNSDTNTMEVDAE